MQEGAKKSPLFTMNRGDFVNEVKHALTPLGTQG